MAAMWCGFDTHVQYFLCLLRERRQISDECGLPLADGAAGFERSMEYKAGTAVAGDNVYWRNYGAQTRPNFFRSIGANDRLQMDMYVCAPWGDYELIIEVSSTNGNNAMERVAWEIEYGPDEVCVGYSKIKPP